MVLIFLLMSLRSHVRVVSVEVVYAWAGAMLEEGWGCSSPQPSWIRLFGYFCLLPAM